MKRKRPIDVLRDSAFSIEVGAPEDGPVEDFVNLNDRLLIIKKEAVYEFMLADSIDPDRTNAEIPNSQQRVLAIGSDSPLLCRTLLTAHALFKPSHLQHAIDCNAAMLAAFRATLELAAMTAERNQIGHEVDKWVSGIEGAPLAPGFKIPVVENLEARSKAILYRGHDVITALLDIVRMFYGPQIKHADSMLKHVEAHFEPQDTFRKYIETVVPALRFIWNMRNAVAHPRPTAQVLVRNFALQADGSLALPTIEVVHPDTPQPRVPAIELFDGIIESLQDVFEHLVAFLCGFHAKFGDFQIGVMEVPRERRRQENVRFSYVVHLGGQWQILG